MNSYYKDYRLTPCVSPGEEHRGMKKSIETKRYCPTAKGYGSPLMPRMTQPGTTASTTIRNILLILRPSFCCLLIRLLHVTSITNFTPVLSTDRSIVKTEEFQTLRNVLWRLLSTDNFFLFCKKLCCVDLASYSGKLLDPWRCAANVIPVEVTVIVSIRAHYM